MIVKADILSYANVFRTSIYFMMLGGIAVLFMGTVETGGDVQGALPE